MMSSLQLPPPRKTAQRPKAAAAAATATATTTATATEPALGAPPQAGAGGTPQQQTVPSYEERCRAAAQASKLPKEQRPKLFVPRRVQDFDDGGAFPEIHVAQYPRHMGNPHLKKRTTASSSTKNTPGSAQVAASTTSRAIVNVEVDKDGKVSYDAIVKGGTNTDKIVYTKLEDMRGGPANPDDIAVPTEEEEAAEAARTQAALQALLSKKTALDKPSGSALANAATSQNASENTQFISYTPRPDAPGYNPAAAQRVIQMVPAQVDPMMPPKHKHIKAPRGPAEDPVPILAPPPTKLTKEERAQWNIPACISNWKNVRGYTIPLDKRLAADGRGLQGAPEINSTNFAALSESLYVAEQQARKEVRLRAQTQKKLAMQETAEREAELRQLAAQARLARSGGATGTQQQETQEGAPVDERIDAMPGSDESSVSTSDGEDSPSAAKKETEEQVAARQREKLRLERKRERERELRMEQSVEIKKQRLEEERDVSERIALGVHTGTGGGQDNVDSRLYNQTAGMDSGFGAEDEYNAYSKPLFDRQQAVAQQGSIYRPTRGETEYNADEQYDKLKAGVTAKFQPDKGFGGAEGGMDVSAGPRTAPVQFEKAKK